MKKITSLALLITLVAMTGFMVLEPQSVRSASTSDTVNVSLSVSSEISISAPSDVNLSPAISGISGGTATGEVTWTVRTNDSSGFSMTLKEADAAPALVGQSHGDSFADYTEESAGVPDFDWSVADSTAEFGFTVEPETDGDAVQAFLDNGTDSCNTGSTQTADKCWLGFDGTTEISIINRSSATDYTGEDEVIKFRAQLYNADGVPDNDAGMLIEDTYQATITATATTN